MQKFDSPIKASIIILAYNHEDSIGKAIESVLNQDAAFPFEVVVADDGSSDRTRATAEKYVRRFPEKVRLLPKAPNKGVALNYFDAVRACRGEYLADCAADDIWADPMRLRRQCEWLDANPGFDAVISDWDIVTAGEVSHSALMPEYLPYRREIPAPEMTRLVLGCIGNFPFLSAMLLRRAPIIRILERDPRSICRKEWAAEDLPLLATFGATSSFGYLPLTASEYRINAESISNTSRSGRLFDFYAAVAESVMDLADIHNIPLLEIGEALTARLNYLSTLLIADYTDERGRRFRAIVRRASKAVPLKTRLYGLLIPHRIPRAAIRAVKGRTQ